MNPFKPNRRLPPPSAGRPLRGPNVESMSVGSWCPTQDGTGPPQAVSLSFAVRFGSDVPTTDIVFRLKTPAKVDELVQMLLRHKRDVWPESS